MIAAFMPVQHETLKGDLKPQQLVQQSQRARCLTYRPQVAPQLVVRNRWSHLGIKLDAQCSARVRVKQWLLWYAVATLIWGSYEYLQHTDQQSMQCWICWEGSNS